MSRTGVCLSIGLMAGLVGCDNGVMAPGASRMQGRGGTSGGGGGGAGGAMLPALPIDLPLDLPLALSAGGPTLANPVAIPIFFSNEDASRIAAVTDFLDKLSTSDYWAATTSEYGVGPLVAHASVRMTTPAPDVIASTEIDSWLVTSIAAGLLPAPTLQNIYVVYFPATTTIARFGSLSCVDFGGYHGELAVTGQPIVYAVIGGCASYGAHLKPGEVLHGLDYTTGLTTHELIEAVTDPLVATNPAYDAIDGAHLAWARYLYGEELADMCEVQPGAFFLDPTLGYVVQRSWSNAAARAGHTPCLPSTSPVFFIAIPRLKAIVARDVTAEAIEIGLGETVTIPIALMSDAPTGQPFAVRAIDFASEHGAPAELGLALDRDAGKSGDTLALTITVLVANPSGFEGFILESSLGGQKMRSAGAVFQR